MNVIIALLFVVLVFFEIEQASSKCCKGASSTFGCCATGRCNIFCCNCDGDCRSTWKVEKCGGSGRRSWCVIQDRCSSRKRRDVAAALANEAFKKFKLIDADSNGALDYNETLVAVPSIQHDRKLFDNMDTNKNGLIDPFEFDSDLRQ